MMYLLLALVSFLITAGTFYYYVQTAQTIFIVLAFIFLAAGVVCGGLFMSGRVNQKEDIHITE